MGIADHAVAAWKRGERTWQPSNEEDYYELLYAVPPVRQRGNGYACGEAYTHDLETREVIYICGKIIDGEHYLRLASLREFDTEFGARQPSFTVDS